MENENVKIKVKFTQQQMVLLDRLKKEGKHGKDYKEIIANVFKEYIKQNFGLGGL